MKDLNLLSLVEVAKEISRELKKPVSFMELFNKVVEAKGLSDEEKNVHIAQLYSDISSSGDFVYCGEDLWDLKENQPLEVINKEYYTEHAGLEDDGSAKKAKKKAAKKAKKVVVEEEDNDDDASESEDEDYEAVKKVDDDDDDDDYGEVAEGETVTDDDEDDDVSEFEPDEDDDEEEVEEHDDEFDEDSYNDIMDEYEDKYNN